MNPDFALVLQFLIDPKTKIDADYLVKTARDIGARAVTGSPALKKACQKYTLFLAPVTDGEELTADNAIAIMVQNRRHGQRTVINIPVQEDGHFSPASQKLLATINDWMHLFGHAFNEGRPAKLKLDQPGFVLENRYAPYQKYVFLKKPLPQQILITGLSQKPARVEWIDQRQQLDFAFREGKLTITLTAPKNHFSWQVLRIQAHRPEDDLPTTKF